MKIKFIFLSSLTMEFLFDTLLSHKDMRGKSSRDWTSVSHKMHSSSVLSSKLLSETCQTTLIITLNLFSRAMQFYKVNIHKYPGDLTVLEDG